MMDEEDDEKSFCYVLGKDEDSLGIMDQEEIQENVWYQMKPPPKSKAIINPFVSARQIALVRAILTGKQTFKVEPKVNIPADVKPVPRKPPAPVHTLNQKRSSVRFLNKFIYDD